ncbi:MAG: adenosine kinase [Maricaulaceae bacterium]
MAANTEIDVLGLGNAIMDAIVPVEDAFLGAENIEKGGMTLIDRPRALQLDKALKKAGERREIAGGSAANTIAGVAELGLRAAYMAKIGDDATGRRFVKEFDAAGVHFVTKPLEGGATSRCLIAVTPDGERSMNTFLGASTAFAKRDVVTDLIRRSKVLYLEGYLFDMDAAKAAFVKAAQIAQKAGRKVSITLSDDFCVARHREDFRAFVDNHVDILFANETELLSLYETDSIDAALDMHVKTGKVVCVTRSEKGSVIQDADRRYFVRPVAVDKLVDTTGAGDQYAAGVLAGYAMGLDWADAGHLGSLCAAEVISHYGARPEKSLHALAIGA